MKKKLDIFVGHYGSGKTELALNAAVSARRMGKKVVIADADVVNPFFRAAERCDMLAELGIRLVAPRFALSGVDLPTLPAEMNSLFTDSDEYAIIDVGGDAAGAKALGVYRKKIESAGYNMYMVVNTMRPFTDTPEKIISYARDVQNACGLDITALIANSNLADETTSEIIREGYKIVRKAAKGMGIGVEYIAVMNGFDPGLLCEKVKTVTVERYMRLPW